MGFVEAIRRVKNFARRIAPPRFMRKFLRMSGKTKLLNRLANVASDKNWTLDEAALVLS